MGLSTSHATSAAGAVSRQELMNPSSLFPGKHWHRHVGVTQP